MQCPRCGYDLAALPRRHRCPECGFAYDESMFVLEGWRLPDVRTWVRAGVVYGPVGALGLLILRFEFGLLWRTLATIFVAAVIVAAALYWYVHRRDDTGGRALVRYLITEDGVARVGSRGARIYLWRNFSHLMLLPDGEGAWRLHLYPNWWRLFGPPIVNARLVCPDQEAEAVRDEIQRRINAALRAQAEERAQIDRQRWW